MISVNFTADVENIVATEHLYQWDNGQKLSISGVGTTSDIHFANKKSEKALVVTPTVTSGAMVAPIPNSLLAEPYPILAYVYAPSDDGARTIKSITIYVEARKQPSDFVLDGDEGITTLETISQRANEVLQNATNQINTAISDMRTDYTDFKVTIQSELDEMKANTTIPNADTVDGLHAVDLVRNLNTTTDLTILNNMAFNEYSYEADVPPATASALGLSSRWYIIKGYKFTNTGNYAVQIAYPRNHAGQAMIRYANGTNWAAWRGLGDGCKANTANTAGTLATTASNVCLRNISFGTAEPQVTDSNTEGYVAEGALYGQYE